ncbi:MAG: asparagine synthase C-terminal domain-containing protein [Candidatus Odinarchaeota archaeon]
MVDPESRGGHGGFNKILKHVRSFYGFEPAYKKLSAYLTVICSPGVNILLPDHGTCLIGRIHNRILHDRVVTADLQDLTQLLNQVNAIENAGELENLEKELSAFQGGWFVVRVTERDIIITRDFPGFLPVYFLRGNQFTAFSSSPDLLGKVKILLEEPIVTGAVPPGITSLNDRLTRPLQRSFAHPVVAVQRGKSTYQDLHLVMKLLEKQLSLALEACLLTVSRDEPVAVLLSGGVDSSVLVLLLERIGFSRYELFFTGIPGSKDLPYARLIADHIDKQLIEILIDSDHFDRALHLLMTFLPREISLNPLHVSIALPSLLVLQEIKSRGLTYFLAGQGADELFGGYARYRELYEQNKFDELTSSLRQDVLKIGPQNLDRDSFIATLVELNPLLPYLDTRVISQVTSMDLTLLFGERGSKTPGKIILRELALELGIPESIAYRSKTAMQYGTGVMRLLKKKARKQNKSLREWLKEQSEQVKGNTNE